MKNYFLFFLTALLLSSCGVNRVYIPGSYGSGSIKSYTVRPIYKDTTVSETYISANISHGIMSHLAEDSSPDKKTIANLTIHKGISTKNFNYHYGIGGSYGNYTFKYPLENLIKKNETQNFYNFSSKLGINFKNNSKKYNYENRWLGIELVYTYEFGSYQNKLTYLKKQSPSDTSIIIVDKKSLLTANIYWEKIFILNDDKNFGLSLYLGGILDLNKAKYNIPADGSTGFGGIIFNYTNKKYTFSMINESFAYKSKSINFGISYKL